MSMQDKPARANDVRIYELVVGTWMVVLILFGVLQLLGWVKF